MSSPLPSRAGIGLRAPHVQEVLATRPPVPWFEIHSENYFADGGPVLATLDRIRADYPLALHGVGLSLGSTDPLDRAHLTKLKRLADRIAPAAVSEHLCWSGVGGRHFNDLLPLPYTEEALAHVCARVAAVQEFLGRDHPRRERVEPTTHFPKRRFPNTSSSPRSRRAPAAACWSTSTTSTSTPATTASIRSPIWPRFRRRRSRRSISPGSMPADRSSSTRTARRWRRKCGRCSSSAIARFGRVPTLIEWDTDIPAFAVLEREAATAQAILEAHDAVAV